MRADVVFPQPRGPENRYACEIASLPRAVTSGVGDMFLADHVGEGVWPVAAIQGGSHSPSLRRTTDVDMAQRGTSKRTHLRRVAL